MLGLILVIADLFEYQSGGGTGAIISIIALFWIYKIVKDIRTKWLKPLLILSIVVLVCYLAMFSLSGRSFVYGW